MKYDNETGEIQMHYFGDDCESGEAVFAPRMGGTEEDDGYVICFVYNRVSHSSECHIIDVMDSLWQVNDAHWTVRGRGFGTVPELEFPRLTR